MRNRRFWKREKTICTLKVKKFVILVGLVHLLIYEQNSPSCGILNQPCSQCNFPFEIYPKLEGDFTYLFLNCLREFICIYSKMRTVCDSPIQTVFCLSFTASSLICWMLSWIHVQNGWTMVIRPCNHWYGWIKVWEETREWSQWKCIQMFDLKPNGLIFLSYLLVR